ncbi:MAG TPA: hypothetical protein VFA96_00225, partial [Nocardioides sp.]|nr:hypothetical protein [Nocardioides sp.]
PGETITYTATGTIDPAATGTLSNTATVTAPAGWTDSPTDNNSATDTDSLGLGVSASPSPVKAGSAVTATWWGVPSPTSLDWIGVFSNVAGSAPDRGTRVAWRFTNGAADGTAPITIPASAASGTTYELRLFSNNSFTKLATSPAFEVQAAVLSAGPSPVNAGLAVTATWSDVTAPTSQDWIGVFANTVGSAPDSGTRVAWRFTDGAASGTTPITLPVSTAPGTTYELRLFSNNGFTKLATSTPFGVQAPALGASPSPVNAGLAVTATWSGISAPTSQDWIGVFANTVGAAPDSGTRVAWRFTNGAASGTTPITLPASAAPGTAYELRLFSNNGFTKLATSTPFSVQAPALGASPSPVNPGLALTATWSGITAPTSQDWIGVFANIAGSAPDSGTRVAWRFTNGAA